MSDEIEALRSSWRAGLGILDIGAPCIRLARETGADSLPPGAQAELRLMWCIDVLLARRVVPTPKGP